MRNEIALTQRSLWKQIKATPLQSEYLPSVIQAYYESCFQGLKSRAPQLPKPKYRFRCVSATGHYTADTPDNYSNPMEQELFRQTYKAIAQYERQIQRCKDKFEQAIANAKSGSRTALRLFPVKMRWERVIEQHRVWLQRQRPGGMVSPAAAHITHKVREFINTHGCVHFGGDRMFATAEEALAYVNYTKDGVEFREKLDKYNLAERQDFNTLAHDAMGTFLENLGRQYGENESTEDTRAEEQS